MGSDTSEEGEGVEVVGFLVSRVAHDIVDDVDTGVSDGSSVDIAGDEELGVGVAWLEGDACPDGEAGVAPGEDVFDDGMVDELFALQGL